MVWLMLGRLWVSSARTSKVKQITKLYQKLQKKFWRESNPAVSLLNIKNTQMTSNEFNKKYKEYLGERHYGLDIEVPQLTLWLDEKFQEFIKIPEFKYYQIKTKFGYGRFYCDGVPQEQITEVEVKIRELCK